jgi:SPP1 gp7 family putative phage head morphogenesis protein
MAWKIESDVGEFDAAVTAFRRRVPITKDVADKTNDFTHQRAFTLAGVAQLSVVQYVHASLEAALKNGTPFAEWKKQVEPSLTKAWGRKNSPRLETIFRNATMQAYNAGRREQMLAPDVLKYRPFWMFDGIADARQSPICQACNGVILPWDDAWWHTHTPQLHHKCRSSIRNMRRSDAEKRGITANPPAIGADKGFGLPPSAEPWKPDLTKVPAPLHAEYEKKVAKLAAAPATTVVTPTPPLQAKAKEFADALELRDGGTRARRMLRDAVQDFYPGAIAKNPGHAQSLLEASTTDPNLRNARAYYICEGGFAGKIVARVQVVEGAKRAARSLDYGKDFTSTTDLGMLNFLRTLVHEEIHGHSRVSAASYRGLGGALEEVGTELSARKLVANMAPKANLWGKNELSFGSYHGPIDKVVRTIREETGVTNIEAMELVVKAHVTGNLQKLGTFQSPGDAVTAFIEGLDVTPEQQSAIRTKLEAAI